MSNTTRRRCADRTRQRRDALACMMVVAGATVGVGACAPRSASVSTAPNTGSLTVTITAPAGVVPDVNVEGQGGNIRRVLAATTTLTGLAPGNYSVTAFSESSTDPIVGTVYTGTVSGASVLVTANDTAKSTVTYAPMPGTGGLWVANSGTPQTLDRYSAAQLSNSTGAAPTTSLGTGDPRPFGVVFDGSGNLWVALSQGNLVVEYTASQLSVTDPGVTPTPAVTLGANAGSLSQPGGIAFDDFGNLWVANGKANTVVQFSASQLGSGQTPAPIAASATPTPSITIGASSGSLNGPLAIAFDGSDNLWVANANAGTVVEFTAAQLAASGTPTPAVILSAAAGSIVGPVGLAFDFNGNLWVANGNTGHNTVVEFSASQLTASGAPTPAVVLSASAGSLASPTGLAFDNSGNLWVANAAAPTVVEFTTSQLASSGSPTPNVVVSTRANSLAMPVGIAFDPPVNLPGRFPPDPWDY